MDFRKYLGEAELAATQPSAGDELDISINDLVNIETEVLESNAQGITIALDERALEILEACGYGLEDDVEEAEQVNEQHLYRQYDLELIQDMGDGYHIAVEDHSDDDVYKVAHVVYHLEDPRGLEDKFAAVWRYVGYLKTSAYRPRSEDIIAAAKEMIAKDKGTEQSESVVEDVVAHKTHGAVYGKDGKAKLFMTRSEAEAVADKMAAEHKDKTGISVIPGPFTGYLVKMPESMVEAMPSGVIRDKEKFRMMTPEELHAYFVKLKDYADSQPAHPFKGMDMEEIAKRKAWSHGYGNMSDHYWNKIKSFGSANEGRFEEPLSGYRIVSKQSGQVRPEKFASKDEAQKYLMTKLFANHQDYEVKSFDESVSEAEYQGRSVQLGKPSRGDVKKYKVYVRDPKSGNIKKVNFGDKNMEIKRDNPERRKNFRARHNCSDKKDRTKAGYWSCRMWSSKPVSKIV
jgi:hypothetical protein